MSKSTKHNTLPVPNETGIFIRSWQVTTLEGQILTLVETIGLAPTQEKSVKDLIRTFISQNIYQDGIWMSRNDVKKVIAASAEEMVTAGSIGH